MRKLNFLFCVILTFSLVACATIPKGFTALQEDDFSLLPSGGKLYLWADVQEARPILDGISFDGVSLLSAERVLDRSETAVGVFNTRESGDPFFLTLRGNYPTFGAGFSMTFSRAWRRQRSVMGNPYWYSSPFGIGLAMDSTLALVSDGDPFLSVPAEGAQVRLPGGFNEFRDGSIIAGWISEPTETVNQFLTVLGIPLQIPTEDFFFSVFPLRQLQSGEAQLEEEKWELAFHIRTPSVIIARGVLALFDIARLFIMNQDDRIDAERVVITDFLPVLFANRPQQEGDVLTLRSAVLDTLELSLLFEAFSVYSSQ